VSFVALIASMAWLISDERTFGFAKPSAVRLVSARAFRFRHGIPSGPGVYRSEAVFLIDHDFVLAD